MPDMRDINHQISLLAKYRNNLQIYLKQVALLGPTQITTAQQNGILESRNYIANIKNILREWGYNITDHPDDFETEQNDNNVILSMPKEVYQLLHRLIQNEYNVNLNEYVVK